MPRKTSKTDHVLNLLAGGIPTQEGEPVTHSKTTPRVEIVDSPKQEDNPLAAAVRQSLEKEAQLSAAASEMNDGHSQPEPQPGEALSQPDEPSSQQDPSPSEDPTFRFINVMEYLVNSQVDEYMEKLGVCSCSRCRTDITALALTNLTPKYIVVENGSIAPLLHYYSSKYAVDVMTQLTRACLTVFRQPRH